MSKALVVQHFHADALWFLADAFADATVDVDLRRVDKGDELPLNLDGYAALVVLGGPASASQKDNGWPTLAHELNLVVEANQSNVPTLGICLGAQVIARAAGADVYPGSAGKEIGWMSVTVTAVGAKSPLLSGAEGDDMMCMQWHGDTFDLPVSSEALLSSNAYPNQAFQWGSCLALQPHFEVDSLQAVTAFVDALPHDALLADGGPSEIIATTPVSIKAADAGRQLLLNWVRSIPSS